MKNILLESALSSVDDTSITKNFIHYISPTSINLHPARVGLITEETLSITSYYDERTFLPCQRHTVALIKQQKKTSLLPNVLS